MYDHFEPRVTTSKRNFPSPQVVTISRQAAHRLAQHCANVASVQLLTVDDEGNAWIGYTNGEGPAEFDRCIHLAVRELERRNAGGESVGPGVMPISKRD